MKTDRIVVVTGAAGGMGSLIVARFLANGDTVVATDTGDEGLKTLKDAQAPGAKLQTIAADITSERDCAKVADLARSIGGRVDVLVNVAGYFPMQSYDEMTAADFRKVVDINLTGTFLMIKAMTALLRGRGWGRVVNMGSASVFEGVPDQVHYVAATFRPMTSVPIIINTGFNKAKGNAVIAAGHADLVAFGVPYIANPDLVERFRIDAPLNKPDPSTFYGIGPKGFTDYPVLAA